MAEALPALRKCDDRPGVFVASIHYQANEENLWNKLGAYVPVSSVKIIRNHDTNASKGYGFVHVGCQADANILLGIPKGQIKLMGRPIVITPLKPKSIGSKKASNPDGKYCAAAQTLLGILERPPSGIELITDKTMWQGITLPGAPNYIKPDLSELPYDLEAADPDKPCGHKLVDDMLRIIFSFLQPKTVMSLERVCRRWQRIVYEVLGQRKNIHLRYGEDSSWGYLMQHKFKNNFLLEKLLIMNGDTLEYFDASNLIESEHDLLAVGQCAPNLKCLSFLDAGYCVNFSALVTCCPNLQEIALQNCPDVEWDSLRGASNLTCLRLALIQVNAGDILKLPKTITTLEIVSSVGFSDLNVNIKSLKHLAQLKHFKVNMYMHEEDNNLFLNDLATSCPLLEHLEVNVGTIFTDFPSFVQFKNLKFLRLHAETADGVLQKFLTQSLPTSLSALRLHISSRFCPNILPDDTEKYTLPENVQSLAVYFGKENVVDESRLQIFLRQPNIKKLYIYCALSEDMLKRAVCLTQLKEFGFIPAKNIEIRELSVLHSQLVKLRNQAYKRTMASDSATVSDPLPQLTLHCITPDKFGEIAGNIRILRAEFFPCPADLDIEPRDRDFFCVMERDLSDDSSFDDDDDDNDDDDDSSFNFSVDEDDSDNDMFGHYFSESWPYDSNGDYYDQDELAEAMGYGDFF